MAILAATVGGAEFASAGEGGGGFGPPPIKCSVPAGGEGCYGSDLGPNFMDDARNGDVTVSPHKVRVGELLTITGDDGRHSGWNLAPPGLKATKDCTLEQTSCVFKAITPTGAWLEYGMNFEFGSVEQDYYGVLPGKTMIDGRVVDGSGHGIPEIKVQASGPARASDTTDFDGFYEIEIPKGKSGSYKVEPTSDGAWSPKSKTVRVSNGERETANFRGNCKAPRSGSEKAFQPLNGLYISTGVANLLYYSCQSKTIRLRRLIGGLQRPSGEAITGRNLAVDSGKKKLTGETFNAIVTRKRDKLWLPQVFVYKPFDLQVEWEGTFTSTSTLTLNVDIFAKESGTQGGFQTDYTGGDTGIELFLADPDPSPFDFD